MSWISVNDRPIPDDEFVLVFLPLLGGYSMCIACQDYSGDLCDTNGDSIGYWVDDVTHWQPLPEPPKDD